MILQRRLSTSDVLDYGAELVVVATGSHWATDGSQPEMSEPIRGHERALSPEQVMAGSRPTTGSVVVYDTDHYYVAPGIAELLVSEGYETHLVTTASRVSPVSDDSLEGDMLRRHLRRLGVFFHTDITLLGITDAGVQGVTEYGEVWSLDASGVVLVTRTGVRRFLVPRTRGRPGLAGRRRDQSRPPHR